MWQLARIRIRHCHAQIHHLHVIADKWIRPRAGLMHIDVTALGRQRNAAQLRALLVPELRGLLRLMLGIRKLRHRLLFTAAPSQRRSAQRYHCKRTAEKVLRHH
ncbi:MAG: hypothetical protein QM784_30890 [Polyangiaceae bacterium]